MKLHCSKILLFVLPINILLKLSSNAHNKNKPSITPHHTPTTTSRVLSEKDIRSTNYDNDPQMKRVKQQFDDRTSQRFEEYEERMQEKRQKRKEERDENIKKIIEKDKMEKSLTEKVEIGCLRCGCGLGGVAASVGIFGTVAVKELTKAALVAAEKAAIAEGALAGEAARIQAVKSAVIAGIKKEFGVSIQGVQELQSLFTANIYTDASKITRAISIEYKTDRCLFSGPTSDNSICTWVLDKSAAARKVQRSSVSTNTLIKEAVENIISEAEKDATKNVTATLITEKTDMVQATYASFQTAIIASVVAIIIIALVMIIIYLVLRYRRKKKMKKKAEYTKLLEE
ncbi:rifin PIR protein, putative [Plasmodium reichenowi]|uniref:Rifin PIR protein, putative n=1 Tax=Plasmodium reichenowi TaxID=5854 RepID=A0A2P9DSQ4_PLARE|nr:rifin PIR protein, putative [Plasmodium reichenowi]